MSAERQRLSNREIAVLLYIARQAGLSGRMKLPEWRRAFIVSLWRQHLVEVWFRCVPGEGSTHGPYYQLTIEGHRLAWAIIASRDARRAAKPKQAVPQIAA